MLKRLFNWIKFKVLPPSINFKNRLFLERDSKSRRITNNLGLTFRNSKWADYIRTDINLNLGYSYKQTLLFLCLASVLLFCLIHLTKFYNPFILSNDIIFFYWSLKDLFFHYFFTILTFLSFLLTATFEKLYIHFIGWFFLQLPETKISLPNPRPFYPKSQDLKYVLYTWFKSSNLTPTSSTLEFLPKPLKAVNLSPKASVDFKKLFQASHFISRTKNLPILHFPNHLNSTEVNLSSNRKSLIESQFSGLSYNISHFLNTYQTWNLSNFTKNCSEVRVKGGTFVLNSLNYSRYQKLLQNISPSLAIEDILKTQLLLTKSNRFLYNYSFLHRKLLKNTHKLTTIKKLLGISWYDSRLTLKNIWASDLFAELTNPQVFLQTGLGLSYGTVFSNQVAYSYLGGGSLYDQSSNTYFNLVHYESSFFWLAKRIYTFSTLNTTANNLTFFTKKDTTPSSIALTPQHLPLMARSELLTNASFLINLLGENTPKPTCGIYRLGVPKDLFTSFWENDLLLSEDESLIIEFTNSQMQDINLLPFFIGIEDYCQTSNNWELRPLKKSTLPPFNYLCPFLYSSNILLSYTQELKLLLTLTLN